MNPFEKKKVTVVVDRDEPEEIDHFKLVAEELLHAIETKSSEGMAECLKAFGDLLKMEDEEQDAALMGSED